MELKLIGEHLHRVAMEGIMPPPTREGIHARLIYEQSIMKRPNVAFNNKTFIALDNGVLIIPDDFSYTHFINNTRYD